MTQIGRFQRPTGLVCETAAAGRRFADFKIDSLKWLKDDSLDDADGLPPPEELATDAIGELEGAVVELTAIIGMLENGNGATG